MPQNQDRVQNSEKVYKARHLVHTNTMLRQDMVHNIRWQQKSFNNKEIKAKPLVNKEIKLRSEMKPE